MFDAIIEKVERLVDLIEDRACVRTRLQIAASLLQISIQKGLVGPATMEKEMDSALAIARRLEEKSYE